MSENLKKIISEEEQVKLAENGVKILDDDVIELVSGGEGEKDRHSVNNFRSIKSMTHF